MGSPHQRKRKKTAVQNSSQPFFIGQEVEVSIDRLSYNGGRGVGRTGGWVAFVAATAPGDRVIARVTEVKKNFIVGTPIQFLDKGEARRIPPCPVANSCGGCPWQHIAYDEQVRQKAHILERSLRDLASFGEFKHLPFLPAPHEFRYRNRIQLHKRGAEVGYFAKGTRQLVNIEDCLIAELALNAQISSLRDAKPAPEVNGEAFERCEIARLQSGEISLRRGPHQPEAAVFAQVNELQNHRLLSELKGLILEEEVDEIWDLFCGTGNIAVPLAKLKPKARVTGVELSQRAIEVAQTTYPESIKWIARSVDDFLAETTRPQSLIVVLDPPRPGCDDSTMRRLAKLAPKQILYVSCNPMTFARDAKKLLESGQFRLISVQGLDMFPQTEHIELIANFHLRS